MSVFPPNSTLAFQIAVNPSLESIDQYGNPLAQTQALTVLAYLKEGDRQIEPAEHKDGNETIKVELEGRCIQPDRLPAELLPGAKADCVVRDAIGREKLRGEFYLDASVPNGWGVDEVLGGKIRGYLLMRIRWGTAE